MSLLWYSGVFHSWFQSSWAYCFKLKFLCLRFASISLLLLILFSPLLIYYQWAWRLHKIVPTTNKYTHTTETRLLLPNYPIESNQQLKEKQTGNDMETTSVTTTEMWRKKTLVCIWYGIFIGFWANVVFMMAALRKPKKEEILLWDWFGNRIA